MWPEEIYGDVSIRTQFLVTSEDAVGVYARSTVSGTVGNPTQGQQIYAVLLNTGVLSLDRYINNIAHVLDNTNVGWDPTGKEIHMELNLFDRRANVFVWQDGTAGQLIL